MRYSLSVFIIACLLACFSGRLSAQKIIDLYDTTQVQNIGLSIGLYEDKTTSLGIGSIAAPAFQQHFELSATPIPNFKVTSSRVWTKVLLRNRSSVRHWWLECSSTVFNVSLFSPSGNGWSEIQSGLNHPRELRQVKLKCPLFELDLPRDSVVTFYLGMTNRVPLQVHLNIGRQEGFMEKYLPEDFYHGCFYGLLVMLVVYNLFIYFSVRDRVYLFYILYILSNALFISFTSGYSIYFPKGALRLLVDHPAFVPFFLGSCSSLFSIVFLDLSRNYRTGFKLNLGILALILIVPIVDLLGYRLQAIILVQVFGLLFSVVSVFIGLVVFRRGYKPAKFYLVGFTFYLTGLFIYISADLNLVPFNNFTHNSVEIGTAIEAILLSMAVGDKINNFKREKELAQEQTLLETQRNAELVKQQNVVLEQKVKERTTELQVQKEVVEEKQKEILDSIRYARRIQSALLAHREFIDRALPGNFILFRPKDIVSGDFYWAAKKGDLFFLAVCDSTGHGVPGAFMSLLNTSFLNEAVTEKGIVQPGEIFDHVRKRLIESISQDEQKDGMDGILICRNGRTGQITYAAANNRPLLVLNGETTELPADKMPVGKGERDQPFSSYSIDAAKGGMLYLYTDGYADQFGGPKGKKFKYRQLNELLLSGANLQPGEQKALLETAFDAWRGGLEQVDDVCIVGVRL